MLSAIQTGCETPACTGGQVVLVRVVDSSEMTNPTNMMINMLVGLVIVSVVIMERHRAWYDYSYIGIAFKETSDAHHQRLYCHWWFHVGCIVLPLTA
jgi:hypothetical protein